MLRASMTLAFVIGATANAAAAPWSLDLPAGWNDVTAEAIKEPSIVALERQITGMGGTFEAKMYASDPGESLFIATVDIGAMPRKMTELDAFERAARTRGKQGATEVSYRKDTTAKTWSATQRIGGKEVPMVTRRIEGFLVTGGLRAISINCYGDPAICDPLVASATADLSALRPLSSIDSGGGSGAYRAGALAGGLLIAILVFIGVWKRRSTS